MTLGAVIALAGAGLATLVFIMFPEARSLGKGFLRIFVQDMAATPEGARAIYSEKIEELQQTYNEASDSYRMVTGEYEQSKKELQSLQQRLKLVESQCESLIKMGNDEGAKIKAQERQEILEDIQHVGEMMDKYEAAMQEAKTISSTCEQQLIQMKKEMKDTIKEMQDNKRISEVYQRMDKLRNTSGTDKMIAAIHEKNEDLAKMASGSKAVYQNSTAAKVRSVEQDVRKLESDAYLSSLKNKYRTQPQLGTTERPTISQTLKTKEKVKV